MSKRARRLWLGDWRTNDEATLAPEPDQGDTFVIVPDEADAEHAAERRRKRQRAAATLVAIAALCALVFGLASGGDDTQLTATPAQDPATQTPQVQPPLRQSPVPQVPQGGGPGFAGADLTGAAAEKAAKAALAQFPGDIERVTAGPTGGGYVVHVIQGDGNEVHVLVSDEFKVLGSDAGRGGPPPGAAAPPTGSGNSS